MNTKTALVWVRIYGYGINKSIIGIPKNKLDSVNLKYDAFMIIEFDKLN